MGAKQSNVLDSNGHAEEETCTCFGSRSRKNDNIGSPMPDTPIMRRKRRQDVARELTKPPRPPPYPGLEPEPTPSRFPIMSSSVDTPARIHEGADAEKQMYEKYSLEEAIGVGSTSTVHRCLLKADPKQQFACKVIDMDFIEDRFRGMMAQFQTEIVSLQELRHENIIQLFDVYMTEAKIYIVMEWMDGGEVFDFVVKKGTLTEKEASDLVRQVTSALVYMHGNNICHRDLKPENLLLKYDTNSDKPLIVKIIDFGLSKSLAPEQPVASTFLGTRGYLAPEMIQRQEYTKAVDVWALGVIVFVLVCGCLPFDDDSSAVDNVGQRFILRFPGWANNLSPSAKDLLQHLLDTNPMRRFTAVQAAKHPWVEGETASPVFLASPGRISASPAQRRKHANVPSPSAVRPPARQTSL